MTITLTERHDAQEPEMPAHAHVVQFSEDDASLINAVSAFISAGLRAGDACIILATESHRESLEHRLQADGLDVASARAMGAYISLDAAATLAHFLVDGQPESARFHGGNWAAHRTGGAGKPPRAHLWGNGRPLVGTGEPHRGHPPGRALERAGPGAVLLALLRLSDAELWRERA